MLYPDPSAGLVRRLIVGDVMPLKMQHPSSARPDWFVVGQFDLRRCVQDRLNPSIGCGLNFEFGKTARFEELIAYSLDYQLAWRNHDNSIPPSLWHRDEKF